MALAHGALPIIMDGLVLSLDAGNIKSYNNSISTTSWTNISPRRNQFNATLSGITYDSTNGGSILFNSTDYGTISSASDLGGFTGDFSIEFWFKGGSQTSFAIFLEHYGPSNQRWAIQANSAGNTMIWVRDGNIIITTSGGNPFDGKWHHHVVSRVGSTITYYIDTVSRGTETFSGTLSSGTTLEIGRYSGTGYHLSGNISSINIYRGKGLTATDVLQNYNARVARYREPLPTGGVNDPFTSPTQASTLMYPSGNYYFKSSSMSSAQLLEYQKDYYESKSWVCVFRSPYRSTATTNKIDLNIPMGGLLVQRDALDLRAAVYWSSAITYNTVLSSGNNTADSGYSPRRVLLGGSGGHGIYNTNQTQCNWVDSTGAIGAGYDGSTCGTFPNDLVWGTGSGPAAYNNRSGTWSHWITWS